ncbi:S-protein homolog 29-like [Salvia miltiorrhiza]|uniref:S-protein homolog 29-like n=1 Tax=Salvia miltiorrhiza TaxID=226208 RepID=UPI0025ACDBE5|nr:S-protein homolog 29-like [Salvia miltiorrhiza]
MSHFKHSLALIIAIYIAFLGSSRASGIGIFQSYEVHMINNIVNSTDELLVSCKSADDDLGEHFLDNGDDWSWKFRVNFFRSTLFFCHLQWGDLRKRFNAFDTDNISYQCEETSTCFWSYLIVKNNAS